MSAEVTIESLFQGKMGQVERMRVSIRLRLPSLMQADPKDSVDPELAARIAAVLEQVRQA